MLDTKHFQFDSHMLSILKAANKMDSTLLITGSTGTGKSYLAHSVHKASLRGLSGRWCKINLATLSENLIESELFGHERGAFTGADCRRIGKLETCNGGTVFLDEIGELPLRLQAKLLDFIQYKRISLVGSNRETELDVRIIAATNRNLDAAVKAGEFRADLYHRLNVFHVKLPDLSLDEGRILQFAREIIAAKTRMAGRTIKSLSAEVATVLRCYEWPGNIRELENILEFALAMEPSDTIEIQSLPAHLQALSGAIEGKIASVDAVAPPEALLRITAPLAVGAIGYLELPMTMDFHESKDNFEKMYIEHALRMCGGQINATSKRIGLNKVSLAEKIRRHGIDWRRIRYDSLGPSLRESMRGLPQA